MGASGLFTPLGEIASAGILAGSRLRVNFPGEAPRGRSDEHSDQRITMGSLGRRLCHRPLIEVADHGRSEQVSVGPRRRQPGILKGGLGDRLVARDAKVLFVAPDSRMKLRIDQFRLL